MDRQAPQTVLDRLVSQASAQESMSRAQKYATETQYIPMEVEIDKMAAATKNLQAGDADDKEFERRMRVAELSLKERDLEIKERGKQEESEDKARARAVEDQLMSRLGG